MSRAVNNHSQVHNAMKSINVACRFLSACFAVLCLGLAPLSLVHADTGFWSRSNDANPGVIDHSAWDILLSEYVVELPDSPIRQFRYRDMDRAAVRQLDDYIRQMERTDPRDYPRQEQLAYWMNLYNAVSVRQILPLLTVEGNLAPVPESVWTSQSVRVAGKRLSLRDIEHGILRPIWRDHRIHFGLNCATMDCPNMDSRAYTAATIRDQLRLSGTRFVNDDRGMYFADGKLTVARIFDVYQDDFATDRPTLMKVFAHYAQDMKALYLLGYQGEILASQDLRLNSP